MAVNAVNRIYWRDAGLGRTAGGPAVLAFFDWDSKLPNFQKKMAADAAGD